MPAKALTMPVAIGVPQPVSTLTFSAPAPVSILGPRPSKSLMVVCLANPKYASSKRGSFLALAISSSASSDTGENCPGFVPFVIAPPWHYAFGC